MKTLSLCLASLLLATMSFAQNKKSETSKRIKLNHIYTNENSTEKFFAIVLGLNNTKETATTPLAGLLESNDVSAKVVVDIKDKNGKTNTLTLVPVKGLVGKWTFDDNHGLDESSYQNHGFGKGKSGAGIISISMHFKTKTGETYSFMSMHRKRAKHMRTWEKILMAESEDVILEGDVKRRKISGIEIIDNGKTTTIVGGNLYIIDDASLTFRFKVSPVTKSADQVSIALSVKDCKENSKTFSTAAKYNEKTKYYEVNTSLNASKDCNWIVNSVSINVVSEAKDTSFFMTNGKLATTMDGKSDVLLVKKTGKGKYVDPCPVNFKMKKVYYKESIVSDIYSVNFWFSFKEKSDLPEKVSVNVAIADCNGKTINVSVAMKYNEKTGLYTGSQNMSKVKNCTYKVTTGKVSATNKCDKGSCWCFDSKNAKHKGETSEIRVAICCAD